MAKAIHSMIRVFDLDKSIAFYQQALELEISDRYNFDGFSLTYLRNAENDFELELTHNHDQQQPYTHGSGYGHLAVCVDDVSKTHQSLVVSKMNPTDIKEFFREDTLMARFFFVVDPDGYKIEFIERQGRFV